MQPARRLKKALIISKFCKLSKRPRKGPVIRLIKVPIKENLGTMAKKAVMIEGEPS